MNLSIDTEPSSLIELQQYEKNQKKNCKYMYAIFVILFIYCVKTIWHGEPEQIINPRISDFCYNAFLPMLFCILYVTISIGNELVKFEFYGKSVYCTKFSKEITMEKYEELLSELNKLKVRPRQSFEYCEKILKQNRFPTYSELYFLGRINNLPIDVRRDF